MTKATRRRKSLKGCGKCGKSRCIHKKRSTNKRGGCGTCQTGGNVIFTPTPTIVDARTMAKGNYNASLELILTLLF